MQAAELVVMLPLLKQAMIATPSHTALDAVLLAIQSHTLGHMHVEEPSALGATVMDFFFYLFNLLLTGHDPRGQCFLLTILLPLHHPTKSSSCAHQGSIAVVRHLTVGLALGLLVNTVCLAHAKQTLAVPVLSAAWLHTSAHSFTHDDQCPDFKLFHQITAIQRGWPW
jgi:hypothetical protein